MALLLIAVDFNAIYKLRCIMEFKYKEEYDKYLQNKNINNKTILSQQEAFEDLDYFMYLLLNASFSCIEKFESRREELNKKYNIIRGYISQKSSIKVEDFFYMLKNLVVEINDLHSHIRHDNLSLYSAFGHRKIPYFSDLCFLKKGEGFFISQDKHHYECNGLEINQNSIIETEKLYFVPVCNGDKIVYKGVVFSYQNVNIRKLKLDTHRKHITIKFSRETCDPNRLFDNYHKYSSNDKIAYWIFPDENWDNEIKNNFWSSIENDIKRKKDVIFIDNRANFGGIPYEQMKLIFSLFGIEKWFEKHNEKDDIDKLLEASVVLSYPISTQFINIINTLKIDDEKKQKLLSFWETINSKNKDFIQIHRNNSKNFEPWEYNPNVKKDISFKGTIVLIVSNDTSSWGEVIYTFIKENLGYEKIIIIGTNSRGCVAYSNPFQYILPHSNIITTLTSMSDYDLHKTENYKAILEGRGLIPDFWVTNDKELEDVINYCINHQEQ